MAQLSTQSTGLTDASSTELDELQRAQDAAYRALSGVDPASPEYESLNATALQTTINLNAFVPEHQPATYYEGDNEITEDEYQATRLEQAIAGTDEEPVNIVGSYEVGKVSVEDPIVVQQLTPEELEGEDIIAANIRRSTPGTAEFEEAEGQAIIDANLATRAKADEEATQAENAYQKDINESQKSKITEDDWRVRLHLAPDSNYLYNAEDPGILAPLNATDGIIFPYTPEIAVQYNANYENYDLTHSNYRGYFYTGSIVQNLLVTATFTANDVQEANYMLATMHFLRSATKMFYGQDDLNRGMPPPVVFLTGLGEYQFNNHPCAITMMNYNLPNDVDYIPCGRPSGMQPLQPAKVPKNATSEERLAAVNLAKGAKPKPQINSATTQEFEDPYNKATYVPTKITITFTMIPIQTREQVSKEFSLKDYANGKLLKKGFW